MLCLDVCIVTTTMPQPTEITQFIFGQPLRQLHGLVTRGDDAARPGEFRIGPVKIEQTSFVPPDALHVSELVEEMFRDVDTEDFNRMAPIIQATEVHARFVSIHPFADGNGRIARLLANYFLWRAKLPGILLPWENRDRYYDALEECNSGELVNRGNLSDLGMLFCDLFEDVVMDLEETLATTMDIDTPIVETKGATVTRMTDLLSRLTHQKNALDFAAQYKKWVAAHETILAGIRELIEDLSRGFNTAWGGRAEILEFPIIDEDTYRAIRERRRFSRTWFFRVRLFFPRLVADLVFFFGASSLEARTADEATGFTASLHISRFDAASARFIPLRDERWSRVKEIVHNGSALGILVREGDSEASIEYGDEARAENWFATLVEDAITKLAGVELSTLA
jgi:hypothetical protein